MKFLGFTVQDRLEKAHSCGRHPDCPFTFRTFYDSSSLLFTFASPRILQKPTRTEFIALYARPYLLCGKFLDKRCDLATAYRIWTIPQSLQYPPGIVDGLMELEDDEDDAGET